MEDVELNGLYGNHSVTDSKVFSCTHIILLVYCFSKTLRNNVNILTGL